jgi:hypothetical protein
MANVPDFKNKHGDWTRGFRLDGDKRYTLSGQMYSNLLSRCSAEGAEQRRRPRYVGCTNGFKDFNEFAEWHRKQVGYGVDNFQIDKDILSKGNKVYSPETCLLVPRQLNMVVVNGRGKRGEFPLGVSFDKARKMFIAKLSVEHKTIVVGCMHTTPESAFADYKVAKEKYIRELANKWRSQIDPRAYEALMNYEVLITD